MENKLCEFRQKKYEFIRDQLYKYHKGEIDDSEFLDSYFDSEVELINYINPEILHSNIPS